MNDRALRFSVLALVLLLPWTVFLPLYGWPTGMQVANTPTVVWHCAGLLLLAGWVFTRDRWLGAFAAFITLNALRAPIQARPWTIANAVVLGAVMFTVLSRTPGKWRPSIRLALGITGLMQSAVTILQWFGRDLFWPSDAPFKQAGTMAGTIGNDTWTGAYLAIVGAAAPWWAVPGIAVGILCTRSRVAMAALSIALAARVLSAYGPRIASTDLYDWHLPRSVDWRRRAASILGIFGVLMVGLILVDKTNDTVFARLAAWQLGLRVWWEHAVLFGLGPGGWSWYIPQFQQEDIYLQAHSEVIQILVEGGLVGLALVLGWCIAQRRWLVRSPVAWALAVTCLGTFPFHIAIVGATGLIALAMEHEESVHAEA